MLKNIVLLITAFVCAQVFAEPMKMASKAELASAKKAAEGLLTSGVSADQVFEYAEEAKKSAEKYQLYCTAFKLYAKEEKAEEAAKVISTIQTEFIGAPDKDIVSMIEQYAKKLAKENEELGAALSVSKMRASASSQLSKAKKELKKNPNSVEHKYLIAEAHAVLGDWKSALKQFKDAGGVVWQVASEELAGDVSAKIAAFWWEYKPRSKFNAEPAFKAHSAALYEKLLKDGELSILEKATAESRIEKAGQLGSTKPKSESDKHKLISDEKGLAYCWTFNNDLKDRIGSIEASLKGEAVIDDKQVILNGNRETCVFLAPRYYKVLSSGEHPVTIELWATQLSYRQWSRIFVSGNFWPQGHRGYNSFGLVWQKDPVSHCGCVYARHADGARCFTEGWQENESIGPFELNKEYHIALVIEPDENGGSKLTFYKQDPKTGKTLAKLVRNEKWSIKNLDQEFTMLGRSHYTQDAYANASYNEVRIWYRALSEKELTDNAKRFYKAGETMKK